MISKRGIIMMSKLAVYDKRTALSDRRICAFFRGDYIYRKNMATRICVGLAVAAVLSIYWAYQIFFGSANIFELDYQKILTDSAVILLEVLIFYSVIGTVKHALEYTSARRRQDRYFHVLGQLDRLRARNKDEFEGASNDGASTADTRNSGEFF